MKKILCTFLAFLFLILPCFSFNKSNFDVKVTNVELSSQLKKYFNAYEFKITNVSKIKWDIQDVKVINGNNGDVAYKFTVKNEPSAIARTWIIAAPLGLFTLGVGWVLGLVATPIVAFVSGNNKRKTRIESAVFTSSLSLTNFNTNETVILKTLSNIGTVPQLKLIIRNTKTNEIYSVLY